MWVDGPTSGSRFRVSFRDFRDRSEARKSGLTRNATVHDGVFVGALGVYLPLLVSQDKQPQGAHNVLGAPFRRLAAMDTPTALVESRGRDGAIAGGDATPALFVGDETNARRIWQFLHSHDPNSCISDALAHVRRLVRALWGRPRGCPADGGHRLHRGAQRAFHRRRK